MEEPPHQESLLRYDTWVEEALRHVIRRALSDVADHGLPGKHHFFITFLTSAEGVVLPDHLRAQHPKDMTIVLQHQFRNLRVEDHAFEVMLSFDGVNALVRVPFEAVTAFADPAVNFGLQLKMAPEASAKVDAEASAQAPASAAGGELPANRREGDEAPAEKTGEVITLDTFRKK